ncbi:MAG: DNA-formamidopyrimidine glycosylase family protein [Bacillota bacterium]|nr:DNA-formamidopyrimidine glycosylase family protein [Bacillota bacterium]
MPELPEITVLATQMTAELKGRTIGAVDVVQPKCLNVPAEEFARGMTGQMLGETRQRGKWLLTSLSGGGSLAINLGMGGDLYYHAPGVETTHPYQVRVAFGDGAALTARFWWFGHVHLVPPPGQGTHEPTAVLGPSPLGLSAEEFERLAAGSRASGVKSFLLDQRKLAGVGNVYGQDPLWLARIHPLRKLGSLSTEELRALYAALRTVLETSIAKRGLQYERDLYGAAGGYGRDDYAVAYREGEACPRCGAAIEKIKTGGTSSFVCPACQVR